MDNARMQAAFADMVNQLARAKERIEREHPEWTPEQVGNALDNAFIKAMRSVG